MHDQKEYIYIYIYTFKNLSIVNEKGLFMMAEKKLKYIKSFM